MPDGRLMVNCGGIDEAADVIDGVVHPNNSSIEVPGAKLLMISVRISVPKR